MKNAKVGLGTTWGFVGREGPHRPFWTVEGGLPQGVRAFRISPSLMNERFDVDVKPTLGPWEDYANGMTFVTPEEAAAFLVEKVTGVKADQASSVAEYYRDMVAAKNDIAQLRARGLVTDGLICDGSDGLA